MMVAAWRETAREQHDLPCGFAPVCASIGKTLAPMALKAEHPTALTRLWQSRAGLGAGLAHLIDVDVQGFCKCPRYQLALACVPV